MDLAEEPGEPVKDIDMAHAAGYEEGYVAGYSDALERTKEALLEIVKGIDDALDSDVIDDDAPDAGAAVGVSDEESP